MKKVTEKTVRAFRAFKNCRLSNTEVGVWYGCCNYSLHDNLIAGLVKKNDWTLILCLSDAGWRTNTTKERLNWILREFDLGYIHQKNREWFFTNKDGVTTKREWQIEFDWLKN